MKRVFAAVMLLLLALSLFGCGQETVQPAAPAVTEQSESPATDTAQEAPARTESESDPKPDPEAEPIVLLPAPELGGVQNRMEGVFLSWTGKGVSKYQVLRMGDNGTWLIIGETPDMYFLDKDVQSGETYTYSVVGVDLVTGKTATEQDEKGLTIQYLEAPSNIQYTLGTDGVIITWEASTGAEQYRVFRKTADVPENLLNSEAATAAENPVEKTEPDTVPENAEDASAEVSADSAVSQTNDEAKPVEEDAIQSPMDGWTAIGDTAEVKYEDLTAESGVSYCYTVSCILADGSAEASDHYETEESILFVAAPKAVTAEVTQEGVAVAWETVGGANAYRVFRMEIPAEVETLVSAEQTSATDETESGEELGVTEMEDTEASPEPETDISDNTTQAHTDAAEEISGELEWMPLADTAETALADTSVESGKIYRYAVATLDIIGGAPLSVNRDFDQEVIFLNMPDGIAAKADCSAVNVTWNAVNGAEHYRIMRAENEGEWLELAVTAEASYQDETVQSDTIYRYTVYAEKTGGYSVCNPAGSELCFYSAPKVTQMENLSEGLKLVWNPVEGIDSYRVYKKGENGWSKLADVDTTEFVDSAAQSGAESTYTVRCLKNGETVSWFVGEGFTHSYFAAPKEVTCACVKDGLKVQWGAVSGASLYRVMKQDGGAWTEVAATAEPNYVDKAVRGGKDYSYKICCVDEKGTVLSASSEEIPAVKYIEIPSKLAAQSSAKGFEISWRPSTGAVNYQVFRKDDKGNWTKVGTSTGNTWTDTAVTGGKTYTYTVRAISADEKAYTSWFDEAGLTALYLSRVTEGDLQIKRETQGVTLSWKAVAGADTYRISRKDSKGKITSFSSVSGKTLSVQDKNVSSGETYSYSVVPTGRVNGKVYTGTSAWKEVYVLNAPSIKSLTAIEEGFTVEVEKLESGCSWEFKYNSNGVSGGPWSKAVSSGKIGSGTNCSNYEYEVSARQVKTVNGEKVYSAWSEPKSVTPKAKPVTITKSPSSHSSYGPTGGDVLVTPTGKKYHSSLQCQYVSTGTWISLEEAKSRGLTPCGRCW